MRVIASILAVLVILVAVATADSVDKELIVNFLRSQYVEEVGLLRASTTAHPDNITIYIANDNILASRALAVLGDHELASRITTKLNNEYGGGYNGKVDILLGIDIPDRFYTPRHELVAEVNGYRIIYEKPGDSVIENWHDYADLLVYRALDSLLCGSRPRAELLFLNLTNMWDGYGFRDKAFNGVYATYKCALFIYLYRALEASESEIVHRYVYIKNKCVEVISMAQDPRTGGIKTDYRVEDGGIIVGGDANVETTSIVVLALYSNYPLEIAKQARRPNPVVKTYSYAQIIGVLALAIVIVAFLFKFVLKRV